MNPYLSILLLFGFAATVVAVILLLSAWLGPQRRNPEKLAPYECGIDPVGNARNRFPVHFYLVAITFVVFDVEAVFFYPWAVTFKNAVTAGMGLPFFAGMMIFVILLAIGLIYEWGKRVLDWR